MTTAISPASPYPLPDGAARSSKGRLPPRSRCGESHINPAGVADYGESGQQVPEAAPARRRHALAGRDCRTKHHVDRIGSRGRNSYAQRQKGIDLHHASPRHPGVRTTLEHFHTPASAGETLALLRILKGTTQLCRPTRNASSFRVMRQLQPSGGNAA
jgi:hypothetical protein